MVQTPTVTSMTDDVTSFPGPHVSYVETSSAIFMSSLPPVSSSLSLCVVSDKGTPLNRLLSSKRLSGHHTHIHTHTYCTVLTISRTMR